MTEHTDNPLIDFLKSPDNGARISVADRWLYWETHNSFLIEEGKWVVQYRAYLARHNRCLYSGDDLGEALKALKGE